MIISYKVRIRPNSKQIVKIEKMLRGCSVVYNSMLDECAARRLADGNKAKFPRHALFVREMVKSGNYYILDGLDKHALDLAAKSAANCVRDHISVVDGKLDPDIEYYRKRIKIFGLDAPKGKNWIRKRHLVIPYIGKVKCKHTEYIPKGEHVTGIYVKKKNRKYYLIVHIKNDIRSLLDVGQRKSVPDRLLSISFSTGSNFIHIAYGDGEVSDEGGYLAKRCADIRNRIHKLEIARDNMLTVNGGLVGENVTRMNECIDRAYEHLQNIIRTYVDDIVAAIKRYNPDAILMESFTVKYYKTFCRNDESYQSLIDEREWKYFLKRLRDLSIMESIDLYVPADNSITHKRCSKCGSINPNDRASNDMFVCPRCGHKVCRSHNTALNLSRCNDDDLLDVNFDDISKKRKNIREYKNKKKIEAIEEQRRKGDSLSESDIEYLAMNF